LKKALVIGINEYPQAPLAGCINDASGVAAVLETDTDGKPNFGVRLETAISTKAQLTQFIRELFKDASDIALLYFSGHGYSDEYGGCLVTPDFSNGNEGLSMDEILKMINSSPVKEKIVILDCCHSGQFGTPGGNNKTTSEITSGTTILTACRDFESAVEQNGRGLFTNLLISALQGGAASLTGAVTPGSIYSYIDQALGAWEQRPVFKTNITQFVSLRNVKPSIDISLLRELPKLFVNAEDKFMLDQSYEDTDKSAIEENIIIFKKLQKLESVGLISPDGEEHMYYAAMNSKSCSLTALGAHYWRLAKNKRI
jgi:uncharacterized caspase-like protein